MVNLNIGGKDIPLKYTLRTQAEVEEAFNGETNVSKLLKKGKQQTNNVVTLIRLCAKTAKCVLNDDWIWDNITPGNYSKAYIAVTQAYYESMQTESVTKPKEIDLGLEEIKKNKVVTNSDSVK